VRTTLKRGYGRTTAIDGNGSGRPTLPPDALSPVTLYRIEEPPAKSRLRRLARGFAWVVLVLVMLGLSFAGGVYLWLHESAAALNDTTPEGRIAARHLAAPLPHHAVVALVLGYDHRAGQGSAPSRSDSMMLLRLDPVTKSISMLSIPRDLLVDVKCPGRDYGMAKINSAYADCGPVGSLLTVSNLTSLPINYLVRVNFRGFKKVVNTIGGVWVDVDRRYYNTDTGPGGYARINLQPGYQRLTGGAALDFVRFRHTDSDIYRVDRQQLFVQAMKEQLKHNFGFDTAIRIVGAAADNVEVGIGGGKHVDLNLVASWGRFIYDLPAGHFFQVKIDGLTGFTDLTAPTSSIATAVQQFTNPSIKEVKDANQVALGGHVKQTAPKPSQTSVVVLNGNGVAGSASNASYLLGQRGYRMQQPPAGKTADAPSYDYFHTKIYYLSWSKRGKAAAQALARVLAPAEASPIPSELMPLRGTAMLTVVVGKTFHNALTPPPSQPVITHVPPNVRTDPAATESLVRAAQSQVPFPLMVPDVLESSSLPDSLGVDQPIRVYTIDGNDKAVRLIFRLGGVNEYWGIEETAWHGAPVLSERNFHRVLHGRPYDFYYHGQHLHMVVLHVGKTDYWVVNTLADTLSNETMIAIAEGLQPLNPPKTHGAAGKKQ
jgi:LCP family protein required for cell wall assembly